MLPAPTDRLSSLNRQGWSRLRQVVLGHDDVVDEASVNVELVTKPALNQKAGSRVKLDRSVVAAEHVQRQPAGASAGRFGGGGVYEAAADPFALAVRVHGQASDLQYVFVGLEGSRVPEFH